MEKTAISEKADEERAVTIEHPKTIKDKLGKDFDLKTFFSPEKMKKAQTIINDAYEVFCEDIIALADEAQAQCKQALLHPRDNKHQVARVAELAFL